MKVLFVFAVLIAVATAQFRGYTHGHNGRSACQHTAEGPGTLWRNNFDPTRYWLCEQKNVPAVEQICKSEFLFQPIKNECVWREEWVWTPLEDPYSLA